MSQAIANKHAGGEMGDLSECFTTSGTVAIEGSIVNNGSYSYKITGSGSYARPGGFIGSVGSGEFCANRLYIYIDALPSSKQTLIDGDNCIIEIDTDGSLTLTADGGSETSSFGTMSTGAWKRFEYTEEATGGSNRVYARFDGGTPVSSTGSSSHSYGGEPFVFGIGSSDNTYVDDVLEYDTNSSSAPSWAPDGYSVIYRSTGDSTIGTRDNWQPQPNNYPEVNDDSDSSEAYSDGANLQGWTITPDTISSVNSCMLWFRLHDVGGYSGPAYMYGVNVDDSTYDQSSDITSSLATSYGNFSFQPTQYVPDSQAEIDAYEAAMESGHASKDLYCSEVWVSFDISVETGPTTYYGTATIAGAGDADGTGLQLAYATSTIAGTSDLTATGFGKAFGTTTLAGTGTLDAIGAVIQFGTATIAGVGGLDAIGNVTAFGTTTMAGTGDLNATGFQTSYATSTIAGAGDLTSTGHGVAFGTTTLAGTGALDAIGAVVVFGTSTISGTGALTGIGNVTAIGTVTLSGTGALNATGLQYAYAAATLAGNADLNATAFVTTWGTTTMAALGELTAIGAAAKFGTVTMSGAGELTAIGGIYYFGTATISGAGDLSAVGWKTAFATSTIAGTGDLSATGFGTTTGTATLTGTGDITAIGVIMFYGTSTMSAAGGLDAIGNVTAFGTSTLSGTGNINATSLVIAYGTTTLQGVGDLIAIGYVPGAPTADWWDIIDYRYDLDPVNVSPGKKVPQ